MKTKNMKKLFFVTLFLLTILTSTVLATPLIIQVALNHKTKECGGYWPGGEGLFYRLPKGWVSFPVQYGKDKETRAGIVETDIGTCDFGGANHVEDAYEDCCQQLGYKFVSDQVGIREGRNLLIFILVIAVLILGIFARGFLRRFFEKIKEDKQINI